MTAPLKKTRIELNNAVFSLPDIVAKKEGYFIDEGVDVELVLPEKRKAMIAAPARVEQWMRRAVFPPAVLHVVTQRLGGGLEHVGIARVIVVAVEARMRRQPLGPAFR